MDAGVVRYAEQVVVHLILRNTGVVPASWQFASLPGSMFSDPQDQALRRCPRWARVTPDQVLFASQPLPPRVPCSDASFWICIPRKRLLSPGPVCINFCRPIY